MKSIVTVNFELPTIEHYADYKSGQSLLDYDIIIFDPLFPYFDRIHFNSGGSCISLESSRRLLDTISHWKNEIKEALKAGKTIFFLLNSYQNDRMATGTSSPRKGENNYSTADVNNYSILPIEISVRNGKGKKIKTVNSNFKEFYEAFKEIFEYQVIINSDVSSKIFITNYGDNVVGGLIKLKDLPGNLVLLPYFDLSEMTEEIDGECVWTAEALRLSNIVVSQVVSIDNSLRSEAKSTPKPSWFEEITLPAQVVNIDSKIDDLDNKIAKIQTQIKKERQKKAQLLKYTNLLFENGELLEETIAEALQLIGYTVENFRDGDLEIDHIIVGPNNVRMIGEAEGKDTTAVNISKFRQLESNINEDFERDEVEEPAKGILFGNGFRLTKPDQRESQFTAKCLTNAKRLGTALIRTSDLYDVVVHLLNHPSDEVFKEKCRDAIEKTSGEVVCFPKPEFDKAAKCSD